MIAATDIAERLSRMREAFDQSFIQAPRERVAGTEDLLSIRTGTGRYALRLAQAQGVFPDRPVVSLPSPVPALLGLAGFRRGIVPVYDLAALLGEACSDRSRWLVLLTGAPPVAVAFEHLDGHLRIPADDVVPAPQATGRGCLSGLVRLPEGPRPIVDLGAVRAAIQPTTDGKSAPQGNSGEQR